MSVPPAWPQVLHFFGMPIVIEPSARCAFLVTRGKVRMLLNTLPEEGTIMAGDSL